jgi:Na+/phosphate symporter
MKKKIIHFIVNTVLKKWLNHNSSREMTIDERNRFLELRDLKADLEKAYVAMNTYKAQVKKTIEDNKNRKEQGKRELIRDVCSLIDYQKATYNWDSKTEPQIELVQVSQVNETNKKYLAYRQIHTLQNLLDDHFKQIKQ